MATRRTPGTRAKDSDRTETCQVLDTALAEGQLSMADEAILAGPDPTNDHSKLIYSFKGGWGDPSTRTRSDTDDVADLGAFDVQAAAAALAAAPELLVKVTSTSGADGFIYLDGASNIKRVEYPG